jgi:hypothetical protein
MRELPPGATPAEMRRRCAAIRARLRAIDRESRALAGQRATRRTAEEVARLSSEARALGEEIARLAKRLGMVIVGGP